MAFQDVNQKATGAAVKLTGLNVGSHVIGFVLSFVPSKQNPENMNILMKSEDGKDTFYVYTAGNIKYMINDGKIQPGILTKIVRLADKNVKGKNSSQFQVLQDPTRTLDDASFDALGEEPSETPNKGEEILERVSRAAVERSAVKEQAAKLSAAMGKRG